MATALMCSKHVTVHTHTHGVQGTIMHVWGDCMCGQEIEALTWGLRDHRLESHQQTPWKGFLQCFPSNENKYQHALCSILSASRDIQCMYGYVSLKMTHIHVLHHISATNHNTVPEDIGRSTSKFLQCFGELCMCLQTLSS